MTTTTVTMMTWLTIDKDDDKDPNGGECKDNNKRRPIFLKKQPTCGQMHSWKRGGDFDGEDNNNK